MRVGINASFLRKSSTGIGQVTRHFLEELSTIIEAQVKLGEDHIEFVVYLEEDLPLDMHLSSTFLMRPFLPPFWKRDDLIRKVLWEKYILPKQIKEDGCDALISMYQSATVAPKGIAHIMVVHDIIPHFFPEYLGNVRKRIYQGLIESAIQKANKIIAISSWTKKDLVEHLDIAAERIVLNAIDVDPLFKQPVSEENARETMRRYHLQPGYMYSGGGLEKRKNAEGLLRAYKLLLEMNEKEKFIEAIPGLVISGKLMPKLAPLIVDVPALVKELGLSSQVRVLGFVPQDDLPALYSQALLFAFPSLYEGFGLPVLEAMSQGVPVLTSKTTSLPEVGKEAVMYCDPESIEDIALAMKKLLLDKGLRDTLASSGKERSREFSWRAFVQKVLQMV